MSDDVFGYKNLLDFTHQDDFSYALGLIILMIIVVSTPLLMQYQVNNNLLAMLLAAVFAFIAHFSESFAKFFIKPIWDIQKILVILHPICIVKLIYRLDSLLVFKSFSQILVISVLGYWVMILGCGFLLIIFTGKVQLTSLFLVVIAGMPIVPIEVPMHFFEIERMKITDVLLSGECIFGDAFSIMTYQICVGWNDNVISSWYQVILLYMRFISFGTMIGYLIGHILGFIIRYLYNNSTYAVLLIIPGAYGTYFLCENILFCNGAFATFFVMYVIASKRNRLSTRVDRDVKRFINTVYFIVMEIAYFLIFTSLLYEILPVYLAMEMAVSVAVYIVLNVIRFLMFLTLSPLLSRLGYGYNFSNMIMMVWAPTKGPIQMVILRSVLRRSLSMHVNPKTLNFSINYIVLVNFINGNSIKYLLKKLQIIEDNLPQRNNLANAVKRLELRRINQVTVMKMNRFYADANWKLIHQITELSHIGGNSNEDLSFGKRTTYCHNCKKMVPFEANKKEFSEMVKDIRLRVLKALRISFIRQYEAALLNKKALRTLLQNVDVAIESDEHNIRLEDLLYLLRRRKAITRIKNLFRVKGIYFARRSRNKIYRFCYECITHNWFEIFFFVVTAVYLIEVSIEIFKLNDSMLVFDISCTFVILYIIEFVMKVLGLSDRNVADGFVTYLRCVWNRLDFFLLCLSIIDVIVLLIVLSPSKAYIFHVFAIYLKISRVVRILRFFRILIKIYPRFIAYIEKKGDIRFKSAFTLGKALVIGYEEVIELLPELCDNIKIRDTVRLKLEADKLIVARQIGLLEKQSPWIAILVKTTQSSVATVKAMRLGVTKLKKAGLIDNFEFQKLNEALDDRLGCILKRKEVHVLTSKALFNELPWMVDDVNIFEYLYEHVKSKIWDAGEIIYEEGDVADGVIVLVTGIVKVTYFPIKMYLDHLQKYGVLPVKDYHKNLRFDQVQEDYLIPGNSVGEFSILTGRPYSCRIVSDTPTQAFVVPGKALMEAFKIVPDPINGLESTMWKISMVHLLNHILHSTPLYDNATFDEMISIVDRCFVPKLDAYRIFALNELIEDIVLVEGKVIDHNTRDVYVAPSYIPRNVHKIFLPEVSVSTTTLVIRPKIIVIPIKDTDEYRVMLLAESMSELISNASSDCLIGNSMQIKRRIKISSMFKRNLSGSRNVIEAQLASSRSIVSLQTNLEKKSIINVHPAGVSSFERFERKEGDLHL